MLELHTLGAAGLRTSDGVELRAILAQPKRLALLAFLALARPGRLHRRDELLAIFWPEFDTERARAALRDSLYFLRRHVGDVIVTRGSDGVGVDADLLCVDALLFQDAVRAGRAEEAVLLYEGDLLSGFNSPSAPEFEFWLDNERTRLRRLAADAARAAGDAATERPADATRWYRRALELAPYQESALHGLLDLLERSGDTAGAVATYEAFAARLARELEISPSAATRARIEKLRTAPTAPRPAVRRPRVDVIDLAKYTRDAPAAPAPVAEIPAASPPAATRRSTNASVYLWRLLPIVALVAQIALLPIAWRSRGDAAAPNPEPADIVVLPFTVHGSGASYLGEGIIDLLGAKLNGVGGVRAVDPQALFTVLAARQAGPIDLAAGRTVAEQFSAGHFVMGSVVQAGTNIQVSAFLYDRAGRQVGRADGVGDEKTIIAIIDDVARELLAGRFGSDDRIAGLAALTTSSLPALREYLDGERQFRSGDFDRAIEALQRAIAHDTTFALAYYRLSSAADWVGRAHIAEPAALSAYRHRERLPESDRALVSARHEHWFGDAARAEAVYVQLTGARPNDVEAFFELAEVRFHAGPWFGRPFTAAETAFRRVLELNPQHIAAMVHLGRIAAATHRPLLLDSLIRRIAGIEPDHAGYLELRALLAAMNGVRSAVDPIIAQIEQSRHGASLSAVAERVAVYTGNLRAAETIARAQLAPSRTPAERALAHQVLAHLLVGQGRWSEAKLELAALARLNPPLAAHVRANLVTATFVSVSAADVAESEQALRSHDPFDDEGAPAADPAHFSEVRRTFYLGLLAALRRDPAADDYARALDAVVGDSNDVVFARSLAGTLRARTLATRGDTAAALRILEETWLPPRKPLMIGWAWTHSHVNARLFRAELLLQQREFAEALAWADATMEDIAGSPLVYAQATRVRARALDGLGRIAEARIEQERYLRVIGRAGDAQRISAIRDTP